MYYALVFYPRIEHKGFHTFRYRYEPYATLMPEHLPLIFPVPESVGLDSLMFHIGDVLQKWKAFNIHLCNLELSWDNWLTLGAEEGRSHCIQLHDDLYSGILASYQRKDLSFTPHVAMGYFARESFSPMNPINTTLDKHIYEQARQIAENFDLDFQLKVNELTLVKIRDDFSKSWDIGTFALR